MLCDAREALCQERTSSVTSMRARPGRAMRPSPRGGRRPPWVRADPTERTSTRKGGWGGPSASRSRNAASIRLNARQRGSNSSVTGLSGEARRRSQTTRNESAGTAVPPEGTQRLAKHSSPSGQAPAFKQGSGPRAQLHARARASARVTRAARIAMGRARGRECMRGERIIASDLPCQCTRARSAFLVVSPGSRRCGGGLERCPRWLALRRRGPLD